MWWFLGGLEISEVEQLSTTCVSSSTEKSSQKNRLPKVFYDVHIEGQQRFTAGRVAFDLVSVLYSSRLLKTRTDKDRASHHGGKYEDKSPRPALPLSFEIHASLDLTSKIWIHCIQSAGARCCLWTSF